MRDFDDSDLIECLWHFWQVHKKALIDGREIEMWSKAPIDRNRKSHPTVRVDKQRWRIFEAAGKAEVGQHVVRWKGPHLNSRVYYSLGPPESKQAYAAASGNLPPGWHKR